VKLLGPARLHPTRRFGNKRPGPRHAGRLFAFGLGRLSAPNHATSWRSLKTLSITNGILLCSVSAITEQLRGEFCMPRNHGGAL
jgi:hypothetical protein